LLRCVCAGSAAVVLCVCRLCKRGACVLLYRCCSRVALCSLCRRWTRLRAA
jgi:hypothetical protein